MKRSSKPVIFLIVLYLIAITVIILTAQGLKFKCEELIRQRTFLDEEIRAIRMNRSNLIAEYQMLTEEDFIKEFAQLELGLVDGTDNSPRKIHLDKTQVRELNERINRHDE